MSAETSSASKPAASVPSSSNASAKPDDDLEKLLSREASAFQREVEVDRILKAFKLK
jgi:DnaJ family protein C protein 8